MMAYATMGTAVATGLVINEVISGRDPSKEVQKSMDDFTLFTIKDVKESRK